jgi:hypothetical protein
MKGIATITRILRRDQPTMASIEYCPADGAGGGPGGASWFPLRPGGFLMTPLRFCYDHSHHAVSSFASGLSTKPSQF